MSLFARNALIAFGISVLTVGTVIYAVNLLNRARVSELNAIQDQLSIDTLSLDTQFSLLESAPCSVITDGSDVSKKLQDLGERLAYAEGQLGSKDEQVIRLKQQYTLLQIRDYLVAKELAKTCETKTVSALYFYSNEEGTCADCDRAGFALSRLREDYPNLRVYAFDYNLELGALQTLVSLEKLKPEFPAIIIDGEPTYGFTDLEELEERFPEGSLIASTTATTTKR
ncbi:MAG: hypothetical protein KBC38_03380 [Candidatus Pacebacteria bacterium]|nr:hypothetical protein [Candidatus Paceibacterota bacterium]MBP9840781.1 hypothetical protein [Candidatus Paceibacterota bacterium]